METFVIEVGKEKEMGRQRMTVKIQEKLDKFFFVVFDVLQKVWRKKSKLKLY